MNNNKSELIEYFTEYYRLINLQFIIRIIFVLTVGTFWWSGFPLLSRGLTLHLMFWLLVSNLSYQVAKFSEK